MVNLQNGKPMMALDSQNKNGYITRSGPILLSALEHVRLEVMLTLCVSQKNNKIFTQDETHLNRRIHTDKM